MNDSDAFALVFAALATLTLAQLGNRDPDAGWRTPTALALDSPVSPHSGDRGLRSPEAFTQLLQAAPQLHPEEAEESVEASAPGYAASLERTLVATAGGN